jgi:hypothetical protein
MHELLSFLGLDVPDTQDHSLRRGGMIALELTAILAVMGALHFYWPQHFFVGACTFIGTVGKCLMPIPARAGRA